MVIIIARAHRVGKSGVVDNVTTCPHRKCRFLLICKLQLTGWTSKGAFDCSDKCKTLLSEIPTLHYTTSGSPSSHISRSMSLVHVQCYIITGRHCIFLYIRHKISGLVTCDRGLKEIVARDMTISLMRNGDHQSYNQMIMAVDFLKVPYDLIGF